MKDKPYTVEQEQIARFAKAMGHPARMAILAFLANQESCFFGDIHEVLPIAKATVSQHLKAVCVYIIEGAFHEALSKLRVLVLAGAEDSEDCE